MITRPQVMAAGGTRGFIEWRLGAGLWEQLYPTVFRIFDGGQRWLQGLLAACLYWGPDAYASHRAAAPLWHLTGFAPAKFELIVPASRDRYEDGLIIHRGEPIRAADRTMIDGVPVTGIARTLIDVAAVAAKEAVEEALDGALVARLVTPSQIRKRLDQMTGRRGVAVMRGLLEARDPQHGIPESIFETRMLRVLARARVPPPTLQHVLLDGDRAVARLDFAWPEQKVCLEADGYRFHADPASWERDRAKDNAFPLLGWRVRRTTWKDLDQGKEELIKWIRRALTIGAGAGPRARG